MLRKLSKQSISQARAPPAPGREGGGKVWLLRVVRRAGSREEERGKGEGARVALA